jgi:acetyl-CoA carboxylase carboxyl transferase subunit beta
MTRGEPARLVDAAEEPAGWVSCKRCRQPVYRKRFRRQHSVCPHCDWHAPLDAPTRLRQLLDPGSAQLLPAPRVPEDPLGFTDSRPYRQRLREARERTGLTDAVVCARGTLAGHPLVAAVMDFRFMGGSLGCAVGEAITQAAELALRERLPLLLVTASGGARMQEGALALMQMAKTSQALAALDEAGVLTISLVTDPTYGGVAASYATLTDIVIVESGARLGFAGPRVISQTLGQQLPEDFQTAELLLAHGLVDDVQPRSALRSVLARLLPLRRSDPSGLEPVDDPVIRSPRRLPEQDPWQVVRTARDISRPTTLDYVSYLIDGFHELRGDRASGDSAAIVAGVGRLDGVPVMVIGHQKGHDTRELVHRSFGMPSPAGYRKAARLLRLAAKLGLPVITLIDTPGAHPGVEAEQGGQAMAIAENIKLLSGLRTPVVSVVTGEGGSGGALALGVADRVFILAGGFYSVISPEGCAAILWKGPEAAAEAARALRIGARELLELGVVEGVVPEPDGGAAADHLRAADLLKATVVSALRELMPLDGDTLVRRRRERFRRFGAALTATPPLDALPADEEVSA